MSRVIVVLFALFTALAVPVTAQSDADLAVQAALERAGFSPGVIDGKAGRKTQIAIRAFQAFNDLKSTGELDAKTKSLLALDTAAATMKYTVTASDLAEVGGPVPDDWNKRAALDRMRYESNLAMIAERGHCTKATVERLNSGVSFDSIKSGTSVTLPNLSPMRLDIEVSSLEVDLGEKLIRVKDRNGRVNALFHCSIAAFAEKRPKGDAEVRVAVPNPEYTFKPEMWPEVKNVDRVLQIPAGPRNPVGMFWIGLDLPGYGIHGTPWPELIGKTGSHGCIRLANWDAVRLGQKTRVGTKVTFVGN